MTTNVESAVNWKDGTESSAFARADISRSKEFAGLATLILLMMAEIVSVTWVTMETEINATHATPLAENAVDLLQTSVSLARMLATLSTRECVRETLLVRSGCTTQAHTKLASHVLLTALPAIANKFVIHASMGSRNKRLNMQESMHHSVLKSVEMERDSS